jgi:UDP-N-acetylglucosamine 4-epimerase
MSGYDELIASLSSTQRTWLVTGCAGFIGSNLVEALLRLNQWVVGLDNYSTGNQQNLDEVKSLVSPGQWGRFAMSSGDIQDSGVCQRACKGVDFVLHQAALGSVPRSIKEPVVSHASNVSGFLNMLVAARDAGAKRFVYASSSAVYGDSPDLPKVEDRIGRCLSPYAATKRMNELYADVFARCYGVEAIGLRYFNVFGPRQDPDGPYAAVIPRWISAILRREPVFINGDGETSRDFCYVANVVQANLLAATVTKQETVNQVYNVAVNARTSLNELFVLIQDRLGSTQPEIRKLEPTYLEFRPGDVRHSDADIAKAQRLLGYEPTHCIGHGLDEALNWYVEHLAPKLERESRD